MAKIKSSVCEFSNGKVRVVVEYDDVTLIVNQLLFENQTVEILIPKMAYKGQGEQFTQKDISSGINQEPLPVNKYSMIKDPDHGELLLPLELAANIPFGCK